MFHRVRLWPATKATPVDPTSLDDAKELLYGLPLESFVAERDVLVKQIRAAGNRALANKVKTLRKPSTVAAEVNHIVRADPAGIDLILQAATLLRAAQTGALEGSTIHASELQQQYRAAIQGLSRSAPSRRAEVRAALEAATIDEALTSRSSTRLPGRCPDTGVAVRNRASPASISDRGTFTARR